MARRPALDIADTLQGVAEELAEHFHADPYQVVELVPSRDEKGGTTFARIVTEGVESDPRYCSLEVNRRQGDIGPDGPNIVGRAPYTAELPADTALTDRHVLVVDGRDFTPTSPARIGGAFDLFKVVDLEVKT